MKNDDDKFLGIDYLVLVILIGMAIVALLQKFGGL